MSRDPKQDELAAVVALAQRKPIAEVVDASGLSERTVFRRLKDPEFQHDVAEARSHLLSEVSDRLGEVLVGTLDTLIELTGPEHSDTVRLRACGEILKNALRIKHGLDVEERLARIEADVE